MVNTSPQRDSLGMILSQCASGSHSRADLWANFIRFQGVRRMAEIGVYRGDFAAEILRRCEGVTAYYMVDPWRHLSDWNKPANREDAALESFFEETKSKTNFADSRRTILRGKTTEVIERIPDSELDFAYIDADHTLRGIAIDLIRVYPKVRIGGFVGGDDFNRSIWGHGTAFEPTLVFPFAVYFAEAVGATIYGLPYSQFCLQKSEAGQFAFIDLTGAYDQVGMRDQFTPERLFKLMMGTRFPRLMNVARKTRGFFSK